MTRNDMIRELNKKFAEISDATGIEVDTVTELYYSGELTEVLSDLVEENLISPHLLGGL